MGSSGSSNQRGRHFMSYRAAHRAKSHDSAHLDEAVPASITAIDDPLVPAGSAAMVRSEDELDSLLEHLRSVGRFGYDSEFIGELTYIPKLNLDSGRIHGKNRVDRPFGRVRDLKFPFWELLADPKIEKVVHAGSAGCEPIAP